MPGIIKTLNFKFENLSFTKLQKKKKKKKIKKNFKKNLNKKKKKKKKEKNSYHQLEIKKK